MSYHKPEIYKHVMVDQLRVERRSFFKGSITKLRNQLFHSFVVVTSIDEILSRVSPMLECTFSGALHDHVLRCFLEYQRCSGSSNWRRGFFNIFSRIKLRINYMAINDNA
jgi:hypothetical protein